MDITIFRKNEINLSMFNNCISYINIECTSEKDLARFKCIKYGNFEDLDNTKSRLDNINADKCRRAVTKYLHEYELVKYICKKQVISRAYFKLYEIIYHEPIIMTEKLNVFFICEAPGGFIQCISDIRRKKNMSFDFLSISKIDNILKSEENTQNTHSTNSTQNIHYDKYLEESKLMNGDITKIEIIENTIKKVMEKFPGGLNLVTADGGFDIKSFNNQEIISSKLILCEIYLALNTQSYNGLFVIKFFDMFTHNSIIFYLILCAFYKHVKIIKPLTSRKSNSERYLVCYSFIGKNTEFLNVLRNIIINFPDLHNINLENKIIYTKLFPYFSFGNNENIELSFNKKMSGFNNIIIHDQIKNILEIIKMCSSRDIYFQKLLINLFTDKVSLQYIFFYKNILNSRIKKSIELLKDLNINTNHIVYRYNG